MKVIVNDLSGAEFPEREISLLCELISENERTPQEAVVSITAVDEGSMAELNSTYTGREGCTDVLSFPMMERDGDELLLGDVVVCPIEVARRASEYGVGKGAELLYVVAHGLLHLLGYEDETAEGWSTMDRKVREYLSLAFEEGQR